MKYAIVGSREFPYMGWVRWYVRHIPSPFDCIISGGARGVDTLAVDEAKLRGMEVQLFRANWQRPDGTTNRGAGIERNLDIVKDADLVVAFWDGASRGTAHSISLAQGLKIDLIVITPEYVEEWRYRTNPIAASNPIFTKRVLVQHTRRPTKQANLSSSLL